MTLYKLSTTLLLACGIRSVCDLSVISPKRHMLQIQRAVDTVQATNAGELSTL